MCIFCGGQCGGVGDFFISMGLPFVALYFFKVKRAFLKISNRFVPRGSVVPEKPPQEDTCNCCGAPAGECREPAAPSLETLAALKLDAGEIPPPGDREQEVRGWLLFLCINLTLIIPFSSIYEASSALGMYLPGASSLQFFIFRQSLAYHLGVIAATTFLAIFSFYAGLCLWQLKPNAVKTVKLFLISQLLLMMLLMTLRPVTVFTLGASPGSFAATLPRLIPFLSYFGVWYAYLSFSRRVHLTYQILPTPSPAGQPA
ncbi:MAG: DUF2569 family protein [Desulfobaccales bacterium]